MLALTPFTRNSVQRRTRSDVDSFFDLFDDFLNGSFPVMNRLREDSFKIDVKENDQEYLIEAELPGIKKEDVKLEYQDGKLFICVNQVNEIKEEKERFIHRERNSISMQRGIYLKDILKDSIDAKLEDGILIIKASKTSEKDKEHIIEIK